MDVYQVFVVTFALVLTCFTLWAYRPGNLSVWRAEKSRNLLGFALICVACIILNALNSSLDARIWLISPLIEALVIPRLWLTSLMLADKKIPDISKVSIYVVVSLFAYNFLSQYFLNFAEDGQTLFYNSANRGGSLLFIIFSVLVIVDVCESALEGRVRGVKGYWLVFSLVANGYVCFWYFLHFLGVESHSLTVDILFIVPLIAFTFPLVDLWLNAPASGASALQSAQVKNLHVDDNNKIKQLKDEQVIRDAFELQRIHLGSDITAIKLARQLCWPEARLRKTIKSLGFKNFNDVINYYRIEKVCDDLEDVDKTHVPVATVALEAGYKSVHAFYRVFKDRKGMTPKDYREASARNRSELLSD